VAHKTEILDITARLASLSGITLVQRNGFNLEERQHFLLLLTFLLSVVVAVVVAEVMIQMSALVVVAVLVVIESLLLNHYCQLLHTP
jgi:hypothetical protein